jgi:hypothetical protein
MPELARLIAGMLRRRRWRRGRYAAGRERLRVRARVVPALVGGVALERSDWLTPYSAESIVEDSLRAGPGATLEITVPAGSDDGAVGAVRQRFSWLSRRQIAVSVTRSSQSIAA